MSFIVNSPSGQDPRDSSRVTAGPARQLPTWIVTFVGVLTIILGFGLLLWPLTAATSLLSFMIGAALIFSGLAFLVRLPGSPIRIVAGAFFIIIGTLAMAFSEFTVNAIVSFVGTSFVFIGALWLIFVAKIEQMSNFALVIPPVLLIIAGIVALVWHEIAIIIAAIGLGLITIAIGASIIWTARRIKKMSVRNTTLIVE